MLFSSWLIWFPMAKHPGSHPKNWENGESRSVLKSSTALVKLYLIIMQLAIYPGAAGKSVLHTIRRAYKYLMETGKDDAEAQGLEPKGFFDVMGLQREMEIDKLAGGESFANGA
jgi:hypothetical protein